ncbi:MAG: SDR family NAD(P)-dependent oxidoreductase [Oscillospiraceae bacterium]|nr:SDR family NAD(P)-dependent oxidoreductase [Oscillospiraceae bacterium]
MSCAIITGASSGIGREFVRQLDAFSPVDTLYVIARREEKLRELQAFTRAKVVPLPLDLTDPSSGDVYAAFLRERAPKVKLFVCAAGFGKFEPFASGDRDAHNRMVDLNCRALQELTYLTLPYMQRGGKMVLMASMSSFQPVPYIALYGATKAFVLSFARALNAECRTQGKGIQVLALAPYWVRTDFFKVAQKDDLISNFPVMYEPSYVVRACFRTLQKHPKKDVCVPGVYAAWQQRMVKLLPHKLVMEIWLRQQNLLSR